MLLEKEMYIIIVFITIITRFVWIHQEQIPIALKNKTICNKRAYTIDIADSTKNINFSKAGYYCSLEGNIVTCDSVHDGNGDGKCKSGETCIKFEITSQGINTLQKRIDSVALKDIEVEDV